ncbi:MAG: transglutaminase domain-containing protein [Oscillospiraceae bacterium]|jgi:transglutaminase/protease-like cytokinesis protein 3
MKAITFKNRMLTALLCIGILLMTACTPPDTVDVSTPSTQTSGTTTVTTTSTTTTPQTSTTASSSVTTTTEETTTPTPPTTTTTTTAYVPPSGGFNETGRVPYVFNQLTEKQLSVYNQLDECIKNNYSSVNLNTQISISEFKSVVELLTDYGFMYTHIDKDYLHGSNPATGNVTYAEFYYTYSKQEAQAKTAQLKTKVDEIIAEMPASTEFDKIKYFHDYIIRNCKYNIDAANPYSAYGVLVENEGVCEGYSKAMALLCNTAGIECILVKGYGDDQPHMWNMIKFNGEWYHMDVTWDDPVNPHYFDEDFVQYVYFNVTTDMILKDHTTIDTPSLYQRPTAYSMDGNYFIMTDTVVKSVDDAAVVIERELIKASANKQKTITFKAATETIFNDVFQHFFTNRQIFKILKIANEKAENKFVTDKCSPLSDKNCYTFTVSITY